MRFSLRLNHQPSLLFSASSVTPSVIARSVATRQSSRFKSVAVGDNRSVCRHLDCRDACGRLAMTEVEEHTVTTNCNLDNGNTNVRKIKKENACNRDGNVVK